MTVTERRDYEVSQVPRSLLRSLRRRRYHRLNLQMRKLREDIVRRGWVLERTPLISTCCVTLSRFLNLFEAPFSSL